MMNTFPSRDLQDVQIIVTSDFGPTILARGECHLPADPGPAWLYICFPLIYVSHPKGDVIGPGGYGQVIGSSR